MEPKFIYAPAIAESEFRCKVPLKNTRQTYILNGKVQGGKSPFTLEVKRGETMDEMLQLICVRNEACTAPISFEENFRFGEGSVGRVLQCSHTFSMDEFITDETVVIEVGANAVVDFFVLQNEHNKAIHRATFNVSIAEGGHLNMVFVQLHGGEIDNTINIDLNGPHAECLLNGLYLTDAKQLMNNHVTLRHNVPDCYSNQLFKGILEDEGITRFGGLIYVAPDAQHTEAFQANHNLLLSDTAKAFAKPQLEIYADDVKCSHGATVGRLNEDELFYLRTRGVSEDEARLLLQMAFAFEVLKNITDDDLRERMESLVEKRLRGEFAHCKNCSKNCC